MRLLFCLFAVQLAQAQSPDPALAYRTPTVRAQGSATITEKPDQIRIDIGVVTQAQTAQAAGAANAKRFSEVVSSMKTLLGDAADIQTISYSVNPNYRYPREGGTPAITGFTANNVVRVTSGDITLAGKIIDASTKTGANEIRGIEFSVKNEQALRGKALAAAARSARANAEAMAAAIGLRITRVMRVEEATPVQIRPVREMMMAQAKSADVPTPVEPGTIRVDATVALTAEVAQ